MSASTFGSTRPRPTIKPALPTYPIHNLGYLESTDSPPTRKTWSYELDYVMPPDLRYVDGDIIKFVMFGGTKLISFFAQIVEEFLPADKSLPRWRTRIQCNPIFKDTEGGASIPAALQVGNFQPVNTSHFNGVLTKYETNVQAALDKIASAVRETLTANRTYYVATAADGGSDDNNGLTSGAPFLTWQHAIDIVANLDIGPNAVTIQVADGTYTDTVEVLAPFVGSGTVTIKGHTGTPTNVVLSVAAWDAIHVTNAAVLIVKDFQVTVAGNTGGRGCCLYADAFGTIQYSGIDFGACALDHISCVNGNVQMIGNSTISGSARRHVSQYGGTMRIQSMTLTLSGTPNFSSAYCFSYGPGICYSNGMTYSGAATGKRYDLQLNACFLSGGITPPGNVAGTTATGGQYV